MQYIILFLSMMFCHIVDDYYLQGWLASAKQKKWWETNAPDSLYKNDYWMALSEHAFSWTVMIHIPIIIWSYIVGAHISVYLFVCVFMINWFVHAVTDNAKANLMKINLIQDQKIHFVQILMTFIFYIFMYF